MTSHTPIRCTHPSLSTTYEHWRNPSSPLRCRRNWSGSSLCQRFWCAFLAPAESLCGRPHSSHATSPSPSLRVRVVTWVPSSVFSGTTAILVVYLRYTPSMVMGSSDSGVGV
ncbi:hypothetical protein EXIGLDRAFT_192678 [Exidia glandulosa HHB12029]|uniref:Uncharacterized protein n=1 Tax=Exidia glandulosa HHB12029 TaxID=1314781 RepID=A0A165EX71_EXIGL|nr:hypothetical protein EXIGLDRAFT_192678 [Exidia glandulosa HHB12029]